MVVVAEGTNNGDGAAEEDEHEQGRKEGLVDNLGRCFHEERGQEEEGQGVGEDDTDLVQMGLENVAPKTR